MDLANCTITSITAPNAPDKGGKITFPSPTTIAVPALLTSPSKKQRVDLAALKLEATAQLRVMKEKLPAGVTIAAGYEIRLTTTAGTSRVLTATDVTDTDWKGLSSYRVFCMEGRK
jgi:hypothetical protein